MFTLRHMPEKKTEGHIILIQSQQKVQAGSACKNAKKKCHGAKCSSMVCSLFLSTHRHGRKCMERHDVQTKLEREGRGDGRKKVTVP